MKKAVDKVKSRFSRPYTVRMNPLESHAPLPDRQTAREAANDNADTGAIRASEIATIFNEARESLNEGKNGKAELLRSQGYDLLLALEKDGLVAEDAIAALRAEAEALYELVG